MDTGSERRETFELYEEISKDSKVRIINFGNGFNFSAANNFGALRSTGAVLVFLNNDIEVIEESWLEELVRWTEFPDIGVVGAKLLYPNGLIQHAGVILGLGGHAGHVFIGAREGEVGPFGSTEWYRDYLAVTAACMMMRREVYEDVGGFDEDYKLVFGDVDLCLRIVEKGYRVVYTPFARLLHHEGASRRRYIPRQDIRKAYFDLLPYVRSGDPYYNPNLSYSNPFPRIVGRREESRIARLERILNESGGLEEDLLG